MNDEDATTTTNDRPGNADRRFRWIVLAALVGLAIATIATPFGKPFRDQISIYIVSALGTDIDGENQRLKDEIDRLSGIIKKQLDGFEAERVRLTELADDRKNVKSAYIAFASRSAQFCYREIGRWISDGKVSVFSTDEKRSTWNIVYNNDRIHVRCSGSKFSDTTYAVLSTSSQIETLESLYKELVNEFAKYQARNSVTAPGDREWMGNGPYTMVVSIRMRTTFDNYRLWQDRQDMPKYFKDAVEMLGANGSCYEGVNRGLLCSFIYPRTSMTFMLSDVGDLSMADGRDAFKMDSEGNVTMIEIAGDEEVKFSVPVLISALNFGEYDISSERHIFLGNDFVELLKEMPGVEKGVAVDYTFRSWK